MIRDRHEPLFILLKPLSIRDPPLFRCWLQVPKFPTSIRDPPERPQWFMRSLIEKHEADGHTHGF